MIFRQSARPDRVDLSDFAAMNALEVTLAGRPLDHRP